MGKVALNMRDIFSSFAYLIKHVVITREEQCIGFYTWGDLLFQLRSPKLFQ